ncbi:MAG: DUF3786 domain-containing protein [Deltaproteobacteria bacterium]|nr:MAG: DUF3786 domain-containing protein [Deltaproteobacteria bacterium]
MTRNEDYSEAFRLASQELAKTNLHRICSVSGAVCVDDANGQPAISLQFMNQEHLVEFKPKVEVLLQKNREPVPIPEQIILLHYLLTARGDPLTKNRITFRQVPEGPFYYSAFRKRARDPLVKTFGAEPKRLLVCGSQLGAKPDQLGDASITFNALPRVPVTVVLWAGDDELPPEGSLLFDESIVNYLPTEDIAVLSWIIVYRLIYFNRSLS